ncbi:uncharacterized protein LOC118197301 isoform X2 [Stegodyphus dumicola]|uniref:uncharacterized protein LOC118197301 isoform X2 n=1 Tax=Stegodyphus dumicola TaxID=202533 RepID=UPI0015B2B95E|nr:uncharacterized protein LOC118197301 isoform X2 [Stegodyphus dumicola]
MSRFGNCLYFIALLYFTEMFSNVMLQTEEEKEIFLCMLRQICECEGGAENYKRCYSYLKKETAQWFFEEATKCHYGTITSYDDMVEIGCSIPREDFYDCFKKMDEKIETSNNPMKYDEFIGLESSRSCCVPNLSMCVDNPDDCF